MRKQFLILLLVPSVGYGVSLNVYSVNFNGQNYVNSAPYVIWSGADILKSAALSTWVAADQYLLIQTDGKFQQGNWGVQVFTDNTAGPNSFQVPDYFLGKTFHAGGPVSGPLTPRYTGQQGFMDPVTQIVQIPKSGLISQDTLERLPVAWKISDPPASTPAKPADKDLLENTDADKVTTKCFFKNCDWLFFLDKGDQKLSPGPVSAWTDNFGYSVPLNTDGAQYAANNRWKPTYVNGYTSQLLFLATNFRNATRQLYSTTVFVELFTY